MCVDKTLRNRNAGKTCISGRSRELLAVYCAIFPQSWEEDSMKAMEVMRKVYLPNEG